MKPPVKRKVKILWFRTILVVWTTWLLAMWFDKLTDGDYPILVLGLIFFPMYGLQYWYMKDEPPETPP